MPLALDNLTDTSVRLEHNRKTLRSKMMELTFTGSNAQRHGVPEVKQVSPNCRSVSVKKVNSCPSRLRCEVELARLLRRSAKAV